MTKIVKYVWQQNILYIVGTVKHYSGIGFQYVTVKCLKLKQNVILYWKPYL